MGKPILIASSSYDVDTHAPVCDALVRRGYPVVVYQTDQLMSEAETFCLSVTADGRLAMSYNDSPMGPDDVAAAWYWKVTSVRVPDADVNAAKQLSFVNEMSQLQHSIWWLYPEEIWLNSPSKTFAANHKLGQLLAAKRVGFTIPETVVSNQWQSIERLLMEHHDEIIVKMSRGVIADQNVIRGMYTTRLDRTGVDELRDRTVPFPGIYQPFVPKAREWRITVVGNRAFSVAIYTRDDAKDDWRKKQLIPDAVTVRAEQPPAGVSEKCFAFLEALSLKYGAFDLVETPDGEIVFLECNPTGMYMWLEDGLGLAIADAIADELVAIASRRG